MWDLPDEASEPASHYELVVEERASPAEVKQRALSYLNQLEGWCSPQKASVLVDLVQKVQPKVIVEIGVWGGKSFIPMASVLQANKKGVAYGIDAWESEASVQEIMNQDSKTWWAKVDHTAIMEKLIHKVTEFDLDKHVVLIKSSSEDAPPINNIDILHIDGNHSEKTSYFDVTKWVPMVRDGGWIIFDDMTWFEEGVFTTARAVEWLNKNCIKIGEFSDVCVWGIWVKPPAPHS